MALQEARVWSFQSWRAQAGSPDAQVPTQAPPPELLPLWPRLSLLGERCGTSGALQLAGPWPQAQSRLWAAVLWTEGQAESCLALFEETPSSVTVLAQSRIPAGHSERYGESYAPTLKPVLLRLPEQRLVLRVETSAMGAGGGGGDDMTLYLAESGSFRPVLQVGLNGSTDINSAMLDEASSCTAGMELHPWRDEAWLKVRSCFDGKPSVMGYRFDGQRFTRHEGALPWPDAGTP